MSDTIETLVDYPTYVLLADMKKGESFFYNSRAYTVCQSFAVAGEIGCYSVEDAQVVQFPVSAEVRRVDLQITVSEWSGHSDLLVPETEPGQYDGPDLRLRGGYAGEFDE